MQTETKAKVDQVMAAGGRPVAVLRFTGDISSSSRDTVLGTYEGVVKSRPRKSSAKSSLPLLLNIVNGGITRKVDRVRRTGAPPDSKSITSTSTGRLFDLSASRP